MSEALGIDQAALVNLVRSAMASGAMCFMEKARDGLVDPLAPLAPLTDAFGEFPAEFLRIRVDLVDALTAGSE